MRIETIPEIDKGTKTLIFSILLISIIFAGIGLAVICGEFTRRMDQVRKPETVQEWKEYQRLERKHVNPVNGRGHAFITWEEDGITYFMDDTGRKGVWL